MRTAHIISQKLFNKIDAGEESVGAILRDDLLASLRQIAAFENEYVATHRKLAVFADQQRVVTAEDQPLVKALSVLLKAVSVLEEDGRNRLASQIGLLGALVGEEIGAYASNFWERVITISRLTDQHFEGVDYFYKIAGDIFLSEVQNIDRGHAKGVRVLGFTPILFLPDERFSMARIYAYKQLTKYIARQPAGELMYLFCDASTRQELHKLPPEEVELAKALIQDYANKKPNVQIKYFREAFGRRSSMLGTERGVTQERAEIHDGETDAEEKVLVREVRGEALKSERASYDDLFKGNGSPTHDITPVYLKLWCSEPAACLFARNHGVYSGNDQGDLGRTRVAVIGLGCIGGLVSQALTRIGFQHLTLVDGDVFEPENINRQPYASYDTIGELKVEVTASELRRINSRIEPVIVKRNIEIGNAAEIIGNADIVVQCVDSVISRLLIHRVAKDLGKPVVTMSGQPPYRGIVSTFDSDGSTYEDVMGFDNDVIATATEELLPSLQLKSLKDCKYDRAQVAAKHAPEHKRDVLNEWLGGFKHGTSGWAVTFERTWIMAVIQAHEVVKLASRNDSAHVVRAPAAIIIDLADAPNIVRVAAPVAGEKLAVNGHWDYRMF